MKKLITMEDYRKFVKLVKATYDKNGEYIKKELTLDEFIEFANFEKNNSKELFWFLPVFYIEEYDIDGIRKKYNCIFIFNLDEMSERLNDGFQVWTRIEDRLIKVIL